ncbi:tetratricopeptide repeat protein 28-like [Actinia tenebrosa]|uniref:Tetratricopeptide repeat protein 28-like n=1 Tax=Actinia tenebrosa TaxID=6105 RepID=A0A6P8IGI8_ACTTE|nr:tetratricopeptide repeat protein 28-like [Actinia tenebrosa]
MCYKVLANVFFHTKQIKDALVVSDRGRARLLNGLLQKYGMNGEINDDVLEYKDIESLLSQYKCSTFFYTDFYPMVCVFIIENDRELQFSMKRFGCTCKCADTVTFEMLIDKALNEIEIWDHVPDNCENRSLDRPPYEVAVRDPEEIKSLAEEFEKSHLPGKKRSPDDEKPQKSEESIKGSALEWLHKSLLSYDAIHSFKQDGTHAVTNHIKYFGQEDEILIIPDGSLYKVPFAALRDPDTGRYLSEDKRIRLIPSLATLKALHGRTEDYYSKNGAVIVGNPLVGKVMFDGEETEFDPLDNAFAEVIAVGNVCKATPLTGEKATKQAVIQRLNEGVAVVHIAAHGSLTKGTIALAPSPEVSATKIPDEEDYMLTMAEVQQAQVRAQLVVLSCCHTGRGEIRAEGVVSMCRAFLASGARAVVASLWAIDDDATFEFMFKFYTRLMDGKSSSVSLHQAMNEIRNSSGYSEPKYWAPFFLMGKDVTIKC